MKNFPFVPSIMVLIVDVSGPSIIKVDFLYSTDFGLKHDEVVVHSPLLAFRHKFQVNHILLVKLYKAHL